MNESTNPTKKEEFEARQNLTGFFDLLLKVDRRVNPHLYKKSNENVV
ncbi:hypothetical protein KKH87_05355 [Patescibacteria group bacterium]|nr:hypothetical protein [Patescibacteria group bacterium]